MTNVYIDFSYSINSGSVQLVRLLPHLVSIILNHKST